MAVLPNWLVGFGGCLSAGGPSSLFWGWVVVVPFVACIGLSMAEVISAYPLAGGIYSWCYMLSNKKWAPCLITANMTLAWSATDFIYGIANLYREVPITSQGAFVGLYCAMFVLATGYNCLGMKFSTYLNKFMVFWVLIGTIIVVITVPVMAPTHTSAKWVFTEFMNGTGYENLGLVFFLGLLQAGWTFVGYECGAQIVEGTKNAEVAAPRGIILCIASAIVQGFVLIIAVLFSIQDVDELLDSSMPIATFFLRATSRPLTIFFLIILLVAQFGSLCNSILATGHLFWALARDGCVPYHRSLYQLTDKNIPVRALILQMVISIIVIMPSFGTMIYWKAIMSTAVICINISYGLPLACRLIWTRKDMPKGPFNLHGWSIPLNIISVFWILFFGVILCIPSLHPVEAESMNWASLMIGAVVIFAMGFWFISGRKNYKGPVQTTDA
ncbi:amino acid/polyamine transporter I [Phycomyces nitens]|nr:amino acid/polyamine transporter I [Phycomyces nitens]